MITSLRIITPPDVQPLTLVETKEHLRVDITDEDTLIGLYIEAATSFIEKFLGRALVTQTWEMAIDQFPTDGKKTIAIPLPPLQSVVSIKYDNTGMVEQTLPPSSYLIDTISEPGRVMPTSAGWPTTYNGISNVRIRFVAGYPPTANSPPDERANIPRGIKQGMLLHIGSLYEHREDQVVGFTVSRLPIGSEHILRQFRVAVPIA